MNIDKQMIVSSLLDDNLADVLVDILEEHDPENLPMRLLHDETTGTEREALIEHRRWCARAYGTKLAAIIRDLDWSTETSYAFTRKIADILTHRQCVYVAIARARSVLHVIPEDEDRPRIAIETAEKWLRGEATVEECRAAARDAFDAAYAAYYAARDSTAAAAAAAAACAARAATTAEDAAYYASSSARESAASEAINIKPIVLQAAIEAIHNDI